MRITILSMYRDTLSKSTVNEVRYKQNELGHKDKDQEVYSETKVEGKNIDYKLFGLDAS